MYRMAMQCICQRGNIFYLKGNMLHVKHKRTWSKNLGGKIEMGRLGLSARNQKERTSEKEPRQKIRMTRFFYSPEGKG